MKFYEKHFQNNYEELIAHYPRFYRDVFEMVEILKAYGKILDGLEDKVEQAYLNHFILTADMETVRVWETILGIAHKESLTLDQRKRVILARISGYGHIGEPEIRGMIANYTDKSVTVDFASGVIFIQIEGEVFDENSLLTTLIRRIPAHLALNMRVHIQRTFRQTLHVNYAGAAGAVISSCPVGEDRLFQTRLPVFNGGRVKADFHSQPIGEDRSGQIQIPIHKGAVVQADFSPLPIGEDHIDVTHIPIGYAGFLSPYQTGSPTPPKQTRRHDSQQAGGAYYHTHTKSKLMDRKE